MITIVRNGSNITYRSAPEKNACVKKTLSLVFADIELLAKTSYNWAEI